MTAEMKILKARPEHATEIAWLNDSVQRVHSQNHPDVFKYPTDTLEVEGFFRDKIATDNNSIFIATAGGHAVGYIWCDVQRRLATPFKYSQETIYIHQISVDSEYRRKGVARKLMEAVENLAKEENICSLKLDSWEFNREAQAFFERLGFSCYNVNMWRQTKRG